MLLRSAAVAVVGGLIAAIVLLGFPDGRVRGESVLFRDTFGGSHLDRDHWRTCHWWADTGGCTIASNDELEWYVPAQVRVRGGQLRLVATPRRAGDRTPLP